MTTGADRQHTVVLVVDDEPIIAETLAAILRHSGLAAITALNGADVLEISKVIPPEMLITDLAMPGLSGFDLALQVTEAIPDCEVILFSGQTSTGELLQAIQDAGRNFMTLVKPVHPKDLLARVFERLALRGGSVPPPVSRP